MIGFKRFILTVLVFSGFAIATSVSAQVPKSVAEMKSSFAPIVKRVTPTVVNVYAARVQKGVRNPLLDDPFFRRFFGGELGEAPDRVQRSTGSGVIVSSDGLVVTNEHVIENMTEVKVALSDKREFDAEIVLKDPKTDLAVLRLKGVSNLPEIQIGDSDALEVGDLVLAIGNPFGVGQTVTSGIVSALARTQVGASNYQFYVQTDAAINPGNSGGALVDVNGRLIGINSAIYSKSGGSNGIGFAIPVNMVKVVLASAKQGGATVKRPWFGATMQAVTADLAESLALDRPTGALVVETVAGGPADEAGIKSGDVILAVDGQAIEDADAFGFRFATKPIGSKVELKINRKGRTEVLNVRTVVAPETKSRDPVSITGKSVLTGITVANLSPALAEDLGISTSGDGVVIMSVRPNSNADELGLRAGDVLVSIDGEIVKSPSDVQALAKPRKYYWTLVINRDGRILKTRVGG